MKKKESVRKCPYPFTIEELRKMGLDKQIKTVKALVYDFLKKQRKLSFYYDNYRAYNTNHCIQKEDDLIKIGLRPFEVYLSYACDKLCREMRYVRDFFYYSDISFPWNDWNKPDIEHLDGNWVALIDKKLRV